MTLLLKSLYLLLLFLVFFLLYRLWRAQTFQQALLNEIEEFKIRNDRQSYLIATLGHELRTPMTGILGMTGLLLETSLTPEQRSYARSITLSGRALLSLMDEILDTARMDSSRTEISIAPFSLQDVIQSTVELMAPRAHAKNLEIASFLPPSLPFEVLGDAQRVRQILFNLIGNALKFTEKGGVLVSLSSIRYEREDGHQWVKVIFEVKDTGPGIKDNDLKRIFTPYQQVIAVPQIASASREGVGLGLTISRDLVTQMEGEINVSSEIEKGTTFQFSLPLRVISESRENPQALLHRVVALSSSDLTSETLKRYLESYGAQVISFDQEAWYRGDYAKDKIDVLLDAHSLEVQRFLSRNRQEEHQEFPYLRSLWLVLQPEERKTVRPLLDCGIRGYFIKPVRRESLLTLLTPLHYPLVRERREEVLEGSILLVEDNPINALLGRTILQKMGYRVDHAESGMTALRFLSDKFSQHKAPFLILMDIEMPGLDGYQTAQKIREMEKKGAMGRTPILALTANIRLEDKERSLAAGMDGYLPKPFDRADLEEWLEERTTLH